MMTHSWAGDVGLDVTALRLLQQLVNQNVQHFCGVMRMRIACARPSAVSSDQTALPKGGEYTE
jgi:hypothetical protein